jgi:hypothetical protein
MPLPTINIQNGQITNGPLVPGQPFLWANPTSSQVVLRSCGNFCQLDSYTIPATSTLQATMLSMPNTQAYAFVDPAWNTPGMPHIIVNPVPTELDESVPTELEQEDVA